MPKLVVDKDLCVGCGLCVGSFPEVFEFDDDNKAKVVGDADDACAEESCASCPAGAISQE